MTQPDPNTAVALEAIAEGIDILQLLACVTDNIEWLNDSIPLSKLNELAQSLGYRDAQSVHSQIEHDRDLDECYAKIRQLRTRLATLDAAETERDKWRGEAHATNELRRQLAGAETALQSERTLRQVAETGERAARKALAQAVVAQADAELAAYVQLTELNEKHDQLVDRVEDAMGQIEKYDEHLAENHIQYAVEDILERLVEAERELKQRQRQTDSMSGGENAERQLRQEAEQERDH